MSHKPTPHHDALVQDLKNRIEALLGAWLEPGSSVALVGYPNYWNTGDPAIWAGTCAVLRRLDVRIAYRCDHSDYNPELLAKALGNGPILFSGGGNLGDLWPKIHALRERILEDFPHNTVLQLPQSLWFDHPENQERFRRVAEKHGAFHMLLRDEESLARAQAGFDVSVGLCPDMAFGLGPLRRPNPPDDDIVWLLRDDKESRGAREEALPGGCDPIDWAMPPPASEGAFREVKALQKRKRAILSSLASDSNAYADHADELGEIYDRQAQLRLLYGLGLLSRGRAVVSDRLHAHILCLLLAIPHVLLDTRYGKLRALFQTWTHTSSLAHWADEPSEAITMLGAPGPMSEGGSPQHTREQEWS